MYGLRVLVADRDKSARQHMKVLLTKAGCAVVAEVPDGRTAGRLLFDLSPDLAVLDTELPGRSGVELARVAAEQLVAPVVLTTPRGYWEVMEQVARSGAFACLVKPIGEAELVMACELARQGFQRLVALDRENRRLREELEARRLVEKAKELLMEKRGLSEGEAYRYLRKLSMDEGVAMARVARRLLRSPDML